MGAWETVRGELAVATDREFERRAAPILKLFQPDVVQTPARQHLDRAGIDFLVWSDDGPLKWVVQCKGFREQEGLGRSQLNQILRSIEKFRRSEWSCEEYVLLHNRTGENREAERIIQEELSRLRTENKAITTRLWDRQSFIRDARKRIRDLFIERMRDDANQLLHRQSGLFRFGGLYVPLVPVTESSLTIKRDKQARIDRLGDASVRQRVAQLVVSPKSDARWTLLTGHFGTGKTTTGLHATRSAGHDVIFVRGDDLIDVTGGYSTNAMLGRITDAMNLFDDFDDETRDFLQRIAGRSMAELLRSKEGSHFTLFVDALDESRSYATPEGVWKLINQVADLKCPVVFTTRREHFDSTFRNLDKALRADELPARGGSTRNGRLFDLELWADEEVGQFIAEAIKIASPDEAPHLARFSDGLQSGLVQLLYGDLPKNPLFLQMILEEAASGQIEKRNRAQLIRNWIERKIQRDLDAVNRIKPTQVVDVGTFIEGMMAIQRRVARRMAISEMDTWRLLEEIDSDVVEAEARSQFREANVDVSAVLLCSTLSAVAPRRRGTMPVKFLLRVCQEFFLASEIFHKCENLDGWPEEVVGLCKELSEIGETDMSF